MKQFKKEAKENDVEDDDKLARHIGFLFCRDPLVLFEKKIDIDNETETSHFENL